MLSQRLCLWNPRFFEKNRVKLFMAARSLHGRERAAAAHGCKRLSAGHCAGGFLPRLPPWGEAVARRAADEGKAPGSHKPLEKHVSFFKHPAGLCKRDRLDLIRPALRGTFPCQGKAFHWGQHRRVAPKAYLGKKAFYCKTSPPGDPAGTFCVWRSFLMRFEKYPAPRPRSKAGAGRKGKPISPRSLPAPGAGLRCPRWRLRRSRSAGCCSC